MDLNTENSTTEALLSVVGNRQRRNTSMRNISVDSASLDTEITRISERLPLNPPQKHTFVTTFEIADSRDMYWNFEGASNHNNFRENTNCVSERTIRWIWILCSIFTFSFMIEMICRVGMLRFQYTLPMFILLTISIKSKFVLVWRCLAPHVQMLYLNKRELMFINLFTLVYIVITSVPYDYFHSTSSREETTHNSYSIWREKMVFIAFNCLAGYFVVYYILIFLTSLLKSRRSFPVNFMTLYDRDVTRRPKITTPSDMLLTTFFFEIQEFMSYFEIIIVFDVFFVLAFFCLLIFSYLEDHVIGPVDTSMAFLMAYQFLIPFLEFCEINRIDKDITVRYHCHILDGSRFNNLTIYEINMFIGLFASFVGIMIKFIGS